MAAWHDAKAWLPYLAGHLASNPLDTLLCPQLNWGCRFLRVDHRTLVNKVRDEKAMGIMRLSYYTFTPVKAVPAGSDSDHREGGLCAGDGGDRGCVPAPSFSAFCYAGQ